MGDPVEDRDRHDDGRILITHLRRLSQFLDIRTTGQRRNGWQIFIVAALAIGLFLVGWAVVWAIDLGIDLEELPWRVLIALLGVVGLTVSLYVIAPTGNVRRESLGFVTGAIGAILLAWLLLYAFVQPDTAEERTNVAQIGIAIVAGFVVASGSYVAWRSLALSRERLELDRKSGITENFTAAVEQLGATLHDDEPNYEVRLGGIYALERIAKSWVERGEANDYWAVIEVLTAYLRHNATQEPDTSQDDNAKGTNKRTTVNGSDDFYPLSPDVEAIVEVLRRRGNRDLEKRNNFHLNLRGARLSGANLNGAQLARANLREEQMQGADLSGADLLKAFLLQAQLDGAILVDAQLCEACLFGARLVGAVLERAQMESADLSKAQLNGAVLSRAHLERAILKGARLENAFLWETWLKGADLSTARLDGADFRGSRLDGAMMSFMLFDNQPITSSQQFCEYGAAPEDGRISIVGGTATLKDTDLRGVDLRRVYGLTASALLEARNVDPDKVPEHLREEYLARLGESTPTSTSENEQSDA